jgi:hypothetical protein
MYSVAEILAGDTIEGLARAAARRAARQTLQDERAGWLQTLLAMEPLDDATLQERREFHVRTLRRRLGIRPPQDVAKLRAQNCRRVQRFRERRRAEAAASQAG